MVVQYIHLVSNFVLCYDDWCWEWFMICYFIRILNQMKVSLYILRKYCNLLSHLFVYFVFLPVPFSWALVCFGWMWIWGVEASWGAEIVVDFVFLSVPFSWALVCFGWMRIWGVEGSGPSGGAEIVVAMENCSSDGLILLNFRFV